MPFFMMTGTNRTGRIDPKVTQSDVAGLGTYGLRTCVAVIVVGQKSKRISLTHHFGGLETDYSSILDEIEWVGSPFVIHLAKNSHGWREGLSECASLLQGKAKKALHDNDTEKRIIEFLEANNLRKHVKFRQDTVSGAIFVTLEGQLFESPGKTIKLQFPPDSDLQNSIVMINAIFCKTLIPPSVQFDGSKYIELPLTIQASYMLSLVANQLNLMQCEHTHENVYRALIKIDKVLKAMKSKIGPWLDIFGHEPSDRRNNLLDDIKRIIESGKMPKIDFDKSIIDQMVSALKDEDCKSVERTGDIKKSAAQASSAASFLVSSPNPLTLYQEGIAFHKEKRYAHAIARFRLAADGFNTKFDNAWEELVKCYSSMASSQRDLGLIKEALESCDLALASCPHNPTHIAKILQKRQNIVEFGAEQLGVSPSTL